MPIPVQDTLIEHVGNGVTTVFSYPFTILSSDDLKCRVDGALVTTGFTVSGVGSRTGGSVTFSSAPASLASVLLYRQVSLDRETDYQENGDLLASVINDDFDRAWMAMQDMSEVGKRSLRVPAGETVVDIPSASARALTVLGFDSLGRPVASAPTSGSATELALKLAGSGDGEGAEIVGYGAGTVKEALDGILAADAASAITSGRTAPHTNFDWFTSDFTVTSCAGAARAMLAQDIADVFQSKFGVSIGSTTTYVHPLGSDTNGGTSWRDAFLTLGKALRNTTGGVTYVWPGAYDLSDFRYTDSYGDHPKKVIAPFGNVTLRIAGDDISAATWGLNGDYGGVYQMHVAATSKPIRILRTDLLDKYGEPTPMPQYADLVALGAVNYGWAYDGAYSQGLTVNTTNTSTALVCTNTKSAVVGMAISGAGIPVGATITAVVPGTSITISAAATATATGITATVSGHALWVRAEANANVNTVTKTRLRAIYGDSSGDTRTLLYSTTSYWEGVTFQGYISLLKAAGQAVPQFWAKRCKFEYANNHAMLNEGGYSYMQDCIGSRTSADGANYNTTNGTTARGVEIGYTSRFAGDVDTFGQAQTMNPQGTGPNKNGSSNHDGYVVRVNGSYTDCFGPNTADTAGSYTWMLGSQAGYNALPVNSIPSTPRYGILNQGNHAWLDGCAATGVDAGFNSDSSADVQTFNCSGTQVITNSGTFTPYVPA